MTSTLHPWRTSTRAVAALALALTGVAACGDDDERAKDPAATTAPAAGDSEIITVAAADYRFERLPEEVEAGASIALQNTSAVEVHELVAMRLADDERRTAKELVALSRQELQALFAGPPALVLIAPPSERGFATVGDGRLDKAGRYLMMCFIPTGAEPASYLAALKASPGQPPSVSGGPPHFTAGMYADVTVR